MRLMSRHHRRARHLPSELDVSPGRALCTQGEPTRQFLALTDGHALATVDGIPHLWLSPISIVGWPEVLTSGPAPASVVATSSARIIVLTPVECVDLFGATSSRDAVLATIERLRSDFH